jgi:SLOG cluster3 family
MSAIFLSASVPVVGRGNYYETADPFLIQFAVRQLVTAMIRDRKIVWGGHPAITPMVLTICEDLQIDYSKSVILYQSRFFEDLFPEENTHFDNIILIDAILGNRDMSLSRMREAMLSREDLKAAVFIGGMEGVEVEYEMFRHFHPDGKVLPVPAAGGAARHLAIEHGYDEDMLDDVDFARMFRTELSLETIGG